MSADRPSAVFVSPVVPADRGNGLAMRAGVFLEGIARHHHVTVVVIPIFGRSPTSGEELTDQLAGRCLILSLADEAVAARWPTRLLATPRGRERARMLYPLPSACRRVDDAGEQAIRELSLEAGLVHIMRSYLAPCLDAVLDSASRPPITLDLDELDSRVHRQYGGEEEARRSERVERYYAARVDHVYTAAADDAELIGRDCGAQNVSVIANAARAPTFIGAPAPPHDLLFVGNLAFAPNADAACWLCERIRPRLPGVRIAIVGSRPGPEVRALARLPGVTVAADVPEVSPWYAAARIAVAPLRIGGGTRTKIVEALAHGVPVVATRLGASGLPTGETAGVLVADGGSESDFAVLCQRLLEDPEGARRLGAAGRARLEPFTAVLERIDRLSCDVRATGR